MSDTQHLTASETGAYIRLLCTAWRGTAGLPQGSVPSDDVKLARIVGMTQAQWKRAREEVMKLFDLAPDGQSYSHKRLLVELKKQQERSKSARNSIDRRWHPEKYETGSAGGETVDISKAQSAALKEVANLSGLDSEFRKALRADIRQATSLAEIRASVFGAKQTAARLALDAAKSKTASAESAPS